MRYLIGIKWADNGICKSGFKEDNPSWKCKLENHKHMGSI